MSAAGWAKAEDEVAFVGYFRAVLRDRPGDARAAFELANALDYVGQEAEAILLYERALGAGLPPDLHDAALVQLGSSLRNVGRVDEAVVVLTQAKERRPDHPAVAMFLALALYSAVRPGEALATMMRAMLQHGPSKELTRYAWASSAYAAALEEKGEQRDVDG